MRTLRLIAIALGLVLMFVESWRSFDTGRPVMFWRVDLVVGLMLFVSAVLLNPDTTRRRAFFTGAWGLAVGMLFETFIRKFVSPETIDAGNFTMGQLTVFAAIALLISIYGLVSAILQPRVN